MNDDNNSAIFPFVKDRVLCLMGLFLLQGLIWATMGAWTKNLPKNVDTCPGHLAQFKAQNIVRVNVHFTKN